MGARKKKLFFTEEEERQMVLNLLWKEIDEEISESHESEHERMLYEKLERENGSSSSKKQRGKNQDAV